MISFPYMFQTAIPDLINYGQWGSTGICLAMIAFAWSIMRYKKDEELRLKAEQIEAMKGETASRLKIAEALTILTERLR